jgi:radical SAM superfamily enzyme YgiQ (UPF0313 family)
LKVTLIAMHQISMETQVPLIGCLGILALSSALKKRDIEVDVLDLSRFTVGEAFDFESLIQNVVGAISSSNPNVLGLSTMSNNIVLALEICRRVKEKHPDMIAVLGGPGASFGAERIISSFKQVDIIIRGEADTALKMIIEQMEKGGMIEPTKGVVFRDGDNIIDYGWPDPIQDLDSLPIPDYEICSTDVDIEEAVTLEVGRGCPFACTFCSTSRFFKRKFRVKSVQRIMEEIELIQERFGQRRIKMNHDLLTFNREYIISLCDELSKLDPSVKWGCSARLDTLDSEMLRRMKHAGCDRIYLGIESVTKRMQQKINKRLDLTKLDNILKTAIELNFRVILSFVIGFPEETETDIDALWSFVLHAKSLHPLKVITQVHSLVPEPGSEIFDIMKESLVYDDYGGPGHSDFPPIGWTHLREMIKTHPEIFSSYYYIGSPTVQRDSILRQVFLGHVVDGPATCSIQFAYSVLGDKVAKALVERIDEVEIPLPKWLEIDYRVTMESVREIILGLFEEDNESYLQYDAIVEAEIAIADVARERPDHYEYIEVWYHPIQYMKKITGLDYDPSQLDKQPRTIFIFWNEETDAIAFTELSFEVAELRRKMSWLEKE